MLKRYSVFYFQYQYLSKKLDPFDSMPAASSKSSSKKRHSPSSGVDHKKCRERVCDLANIFDGILESQITNLKDHRKGLAKWITRIKRSEKDNGKLMK